MKPKTSQRAGGRWVCRILALGGWVLAGCGGGTEGARETTFALFGDCRSGHAIHREICRSILRSGASYVIVSGDLVGVGDSEEDWRTFRQITHDLRAKLPYYAAKGDHDAGEKEYFEKEFKLEKPYFEHRIGDVQFFFLDSNDGFSAEQRKWLEAQASASKAPHKIAVFHHPPFSVMPNRVGAAQPIREAIHPILVRHHFCAALCGHDHHFYTTWRDGVRYIVSAGGGASLYHPDLAQGLKADLAEKCHHFVLCHVTKEEIQAEVFDETGQEKPNLRFGVCLHR